MKPEYKTLCALSCFLFFILHSSFVIAADPASSRPLESRDYAATGWPQLQCDAARTGWTPDSPAPPLEPVYFLDFSPEPLGLVQPIIFQDRMYVPTLEGRLYAVNPATGERLWVKAGFGPIPRTPSSADGMVFLADVDGVLWAVDAAKGDVVWRRDLGFGISATPCAADGKIFIGTRNGGFFCLEDKTGKILWTTRLEEYVWAGAAYSDGRIYVGTDGELRVYCLDGADGRVIWRSEKLPGIFMRDYCPVVSGGRVFVRTLPSEHLQCHLWLPKPYAEYWETEADFKRLYPDLLEGMFPDELKAANEALVKIYTKDPLKQTMFALDAQTGAQCYVAGAVHMLAGWLMTSAPPAVDSEGMLQVVVPFGRSRLGRMDPVTGRFMSVTVGLPVQNPNTGPRTLDGFGGNTDEAQMSSCGGDRVYWSHFIGGAGGSGFDQSHVYDIKTREVSFLTGGRAKARNAPIKISVSDGAAMKAGMREHMESESFTAPAIWKDMIFHHSAMRGILAYREKKEQ